MTIERSPDDVEVPATPVLATPVLQIAAGPALDERILAVLRATLRSARHPGHEATRAVELVSRSFVQRLVRDSIDSPRPVHDRGALAAELARPATSVIASGSTAVALASRAARRFGPLAKLSRRSPWLVAAGALPALYTSIDRGADEVSLVASLLVRRCRAAGLEPDPDRLRRAAVQIASGRRVDAGVEPDHHRLVTGWIRRAIRSMLPWSGRGASRATKAMAASASSVDLRDLVAVSDSTTPGVAATAAR